MEGVKRVHYEIIVEEKFYPDYLNYVAYKMGAYSDEHIAQYLNIAEKNTNDDIFTAI